MSEENYQPNEEVINLLEQILKGMDEKLCNKALSELSHGWVTTAEDAIKQARQGTFYGKAFYDFAQGIYSYFKADSHT